MKKNRILLISILVESLIILGLVLYSFFSQTPYEFNSLNLGEMSSDVMLYEDESWILENYETSEAITTALRGPAISLNKGSYTAVIHYQCDGTNAIQLHSESDKDAIISSNVRLDPYNQTVSFHFELTKDIPDFEMAFLYTGQGDMTIKNISLSADSVAAKRPAAILVMVFILSDALFVFADRIRKNKLVSAVLFASVVIESICLILPGIPVGHDLPVHLMRIEGICQEILNLNIPSRMQTIWMGGYGYPISVFYGDWALYLPALLRISGFSIVASWKIYLLAVNILTTVVSYFCFKKIFGKELNAAILTLIYTTSTFRLVDIYVRSSAGEIITFIFLPIIAVAIYGIYKDDIKSSGYTNNALYLGIGMAGLITSHLITSEVTAVFLAIICLVYFKKTFRKETVICYLKAVLTAILVSAAFLVPFLDYFFSVPLIVKNPALMSHTTSIQSSGARIYQYFDYFSDFFGVMNDDSNRMNMSPGLILMVVLMVSFILMFMKKTNKRIVLLSVISVFILFLSSELFPWNMLEKISLQFTSIQFPWRYIGISIIFLTLLSGELMELTLDSKTVKYALYFCLAISVLFGGLWVYRTMTTSYQVSSYVDTASLNSGNVSGAEYIIQGSDPYSLSYGTTREDNTITLPVFNYPYYEVTDESGKSYTIKNGTNNRIAVEVPSDFDSNLYVRFHEPVIWRISELISILSIAGLAVYISKRKKIS